MLLVLSTTRVTNSRFFKRQNVVWRRRQTPQGVVFTTRESLDLEKLLTVNKKSGQTRYKPGKLYISVLKACDHLEDSEDVAWQIKNTIEEKIATHLDETFEISTSQIAEIAIETLKLYNTTAYVKYASYQPDIVSSRKLAASIR